MLELWEIYLVLGCDELFDDLWTSKGSEWTVLYDKKQKLAEPTYSRTIVVRSTKNILDTAKFATKIFKL